MAGFTLIELMVVVAMVALLATLAAPSLTDISLSSKLSSDANRLASSAALARGEAIKRNATITLCASSNGTSCAASGGWEQGWIMLSGSTVLIKESASASGITITNSLSSNRSLSFVATGVGSDQASFTVCRKTPTLGSQERVVTVSATGNTSVKKTTSGICS